MLISIGKYQEVIKLIEQNQWKNFAVYCMYAYCLLQLKNEGMEAIEVAMKQKKLEEFITTTKHKGIDGYHHAFLRLIQYELEEMEPLYLCNYFKNYLLKEFSQYYHPLYNQYCIDRYCELLGKLCKYKDAYHFLLTYKKNLKNPLN